MKIALLNDTHCGIRNSGDIFLDNAAKFYHRNMKIYSNLNRIPMTKQDRVFIIMGSAHTAFLREFINNVNNICKFYIH